MTSRHYLDTGQRTCHADDGHEVPCAGSGQDASFAVGTCWPQPRFELHDNEVIDQLTGLIWCRNANLAEFPLSWQEALDFVAAMNREQRFGQREQLSIAFSKTWAKLATVYATVPTCVL